MRFRWLAAAFALSCLTSLQAATVNLVGSVADESGAPLAGVEVVVGVVQDPPPVQRGFPPSRARQLW